MLSRFHTIPERNATDGRTDGQTDRQNIAILISRVSVLTRDKNCICATVLCTVIMVHKSTSSSYRSIDCTGCFRKIVAP